MDLNEDMNKIERTLEMKKIPLYSEQQTFNLRSAKIYAHLLPECRSTCLGITAVSTVLKLLQAGLKN